MSFVEILQKGLQDRSFANLIITDPERALNEVGVTPTLEKVKALKEASTALVAAHFVFTDHAPDNI